MKQLICIDNNNTQNGVIFCSTVEVEYIDGNLSVFVIGETYSAHTEKQCFENHI